MKIVSFGYKFGDPPPNCVVLDCRGLPNPHNDPALRPLSGKDKAVQDLVLSVPPAQKMIFRALETFACTKKGIAFGCVGGRHRSVALAEHVAMLLRKAGVEVELNHLALKETN